MIGVGMLVVPKHMLVVPKHMLVVPKHMLVVPKHMLGCPLGSPLRISHPIVRPSSHIDPTPSIHSDDSSPRAPPSRRSSSTSRPHGPSSQVLVRIHTSVTLVTLVTGTSMHSHY